MVAQWYQAKAVQEVRLPHNHDYSEPLTAFQAAVQAPSQNKTETIESSPNLVCPCCSTPFIYKRAFEKHLAEHRRTGRRLASIAKHSALQQPVIDGAHSTDAFCTCLDCCIVHKHHSSKDANVIPENTIFCCQYCTARFLKEQACQEHEQQRHKHTAKNRVRRTQDERVRLAAGEEGTEKEDKLYASLFCSEILEGKKRGRPRKFKQEER